MPLIDCARLIRVAAYCGGPSTVVYGFAIVSRNVSPPHAFAMKQTNAFLTDKNAQNHSADLRRRNEPEPSRSDHKQAGDNAAFISDFVASRPAGSEIRK